jgi:Raf kinase inhibitor-like YbhB/YbcL family protein
MRRGVVAMGLVAITLVAACGAPSGTTFSTIFGEIGPMQLTSDAFTDGGDIPRKHTCDGDDVSPPLTFSDVPDGTQALALIVEDPDARGFVHWVLADIPGSAEGLREGEGDSIGVPGRNDFGRIGWGGPCPPSGQHRYVFTVWALSSTLGLAGTLDGAAVRAALGDKVLGEATLSGVYARGG